MKVIFSRKPPSSRYPIVVYIYDRTNEDRIRINDWLTLRSYSGNFFRLFFTSGTLRINFRKDQSSLATLFALTFKGD